MVADNPDLIPLPSIGESKASLAGSQEVPKAKGSKLWMVVAACVVAGIGLGVFVYQQSIAPAPKPSKKPTATVKPSVAPTPAPSASPETPDINAVTPQSNTIVFPKAGEIRVYFAGYGANPTVNQLIRLTTSTGEADVTMPTSVPSGDKMAYRDSGLEVTAGQSVTIKSFDRGNTSQPSYGWIPPNSANKCDIYYGADVGPMVTWATAKAAGEPFVSKQCWADYNAPNDPAVRLFNDFFIILSYVPAAQAATVSPSPSASPTASKSPSPSPSASAAAVASASPTPTPSASARVTMPEGSALPEAGVFEVTAGTIGIGLIFILLGVLGLLLI